MYTFVNFFSQSFYQSNQINPIPTPLSSPTTSFTLHECTHSLFTLFKQTFVVLFDAQAEADANQESLSDQHGNRVLKNRLKRFNLPKLTVEWKYKKSKEDAKNNRTSAGYINLKFCAQQI
ncbi:unnamed protein product [Rhizophagus irregularis]|uniref:Uncharacterized protein n=1 Tax=Rhizophagus irregularis TaxID=588596 RepID=A0A915ZEI9_9GLOM|nr:unnamed protein product [Rhizophagus irregularis]CAB5373434.1 unnamed protein product [Rhizophagus irregularis]